MTTNPIGVIAVFAVSGAVAFLAHQFHKRLLSDFLKKIEIELTGDDKEPLSNDEEYRKSRNLMKVNGYQQEVRGRVLADFGETTTMPLNRQVLYKGILEYKYRKAKMY